jgi:hypothetical protein
MIRRNSRQEMIVGMGGSRQRRYKAAVWRMQSGSKILREWNSVSTVPATGRRAAASTRKRGTPPRRVFLPLLGRRALVALSCPLPWPPLHLCLTDVDVSSSPSYCITGQHCSNLALYRAGWAATRAPTTTTTTTTIINTTPDINQPTKEKRARDEISPSPPSRARSTYGTAQHGFA